MFESVNFPGWEVVRKIGEGSFGGVYEIHRTLPDGRVEKAALKKLTVPKDNSEIRELYSQSFSKEKITAHYKDQMQGLVNEYTLTQELMALRRAGGHLLAGHGPVLADERQYASLPAASSADSDRGTAGSCCPAAAGRRSSAAPDQRLRGAEKCGMQSLRV